MDHHQVNCVLNGSKLGVGDTHEELKAKNDNIKMLANKLKQKAENEAKDMEATKETEAELRRLIKEQHKTLIESEKMEKARLAEEEKDLDAAMVVRMKEVEKLERARLASQMKCERERANREMEQMKNHFDGLDKSKADENRRNKCVEDSKKSEDESKSGLEAAKKALATAQENMKKFEGGPAGCANCQGASQTESVAEVMDAELDAKKKEADALIAKLKKASDAADANLKNQADNNKKQADTKMAEMI